MALPLLLLMLLVSSCPPVSSSVTITHLPGFAGALPFHLETGYVTVDEANGVELFYYFVQSERNPGEDPVILWLSGGPGCSAFSGLAFEIGPLKFVPKRYIGSLPSLIYNPYTWTKITNVIFLDSPVGTGFSFSRKPNGYVTGDITSSRHVYEFLRKWFIEHPQFLSNKFYVAGDSYAGKVVPIVAFEIAEGIKRGDHLFLNLKGYLIGNPVTGELVDMNSRVSYAHGVGIISDELNEVIQTNCKGEDYTKPSPLNLLCSSALQEFELFRSEINSAYTPGPKCPLPSPRKRLQETHSNLLMPPDIPDLKCRSYVYYLSYYWANDKNTRDALHIKKGSVEEWVRCNKTLLYKRNVPSSVIYQKNLTNQGYRALIYSGDKDLVIPFIGTQAWIKSLNYLMIDDWRSWHVDNQVAGYTRTYSNNLTFATVKDAGHTAPEYQPKTCLAMLDRWISQKPL